jgi:hypothetical protein
MQKMLDFAIRGRIIHYMDKQQGNSKMNNDKIYIYNREWKCVNNALAAFILIKVSGYTLMAKGK